MVKALRIRYIDRHVLYCTSPPDFPAHEFMTLLCKYGDTAGVGLSILVTSLHNYIQF